MTTTLLKYRLVATGDIIETTAEAAAKFGDGLKKVEAEAPAAAPAKATPKTVSSKEGK